MNDKEEKSKKLFYAALVLVAIIILITLFTMPLRGYSEETANYLLAIFFDIIFVVIFVVSFRMFRKKCILKHAHVLPVIVMFINPPNSEDLIRISSVSKRS
jgi:hypothetical protein